MEDEADRLSNLCADLVTERKLEPALRSLFRDKRAGEWLPVADLYREVGGSAGPVKPDLFAAWLPAPSGDPDYAVVFFFDGTTQWSMNADYNVGRLLRAGTADPLPRSTVRRG